MHPLKEIIENRNRGKHAGIWSICSANRYVIEAGMLRCAAHKLPVLIEATANQVNQDGGYTGMTPAQFRDFVLKIACEIGFPENKIIFGGDHLGPLTWAKETEESAMKKAEVLVDSYVRAGYTKIHIDTSMRLGSDDAEKPLSSKVVAERGARLARVCENAYQALLQTDAKAPHPVYIVGSEVPVPGGTKEEEGLTVTSPDAFETTLKQFCDAFEKAGVDAENIVAVVVQPGVEFGNNGVHAYSSDAAKTLCTYRAEKYPQVVFEGHSTDYQTKYALREMVADGIAILKVGPALTFALREGLFALSRIEKEVMADQKESQSYFMEILDEAMVKNPCYWAGYYHGNEYEIQFARKYGMSDRCRYYLTVPAVEAAMEKLLQNLAKKTLPQAIVSQYLPQQYRCVKEQHMPCTAKQLLLDKVGTLMDDYIYAVVASGDPDY